MVANKLAFAALLGMLLLMGWLFFRVVRPLLVPIFLAAVLAVLFRPIFERISVAFNGRKRIAAGVSTVGIIILILLPIGGGLILAGKEMLDAGREITSWAQSPHDSKIGQFVVRMNATWAGQRVEEMKGRMTSEQWKSVDGAIASTVTKLASDLSEKTLAFVANLFSFLVGLIVMAISLYYFFADGARFLAQLEYLSPLHYEDDLALWRQFECVSRSVVLGTIIAGLAQAILAGIGFAVVGVERVWMLAALTWLTSLLPFVGAGVIWLLVCAGLVMDEHYLAASLLAIYGTVVISGSDNLIRAYVIGGEAKLHPLLVFVSVIGALEFLGLWGIFAGPMIAALFYSLLNILRKRLPEPVVPPVPAGASQPTIAQGSADSTPAVESDGLFLV